jgi:hypothetical protein
MSFDINIRHIQNLPSININISKYGFQMEKHFHHFLSARALDGVNQLW